MKCQYLFGFYYKIVVDNKNFVESQDRDLDSEIETL